MWSPIRASTLKGGFGSCPPRVPLDFRISDKYAASRLLNLSQTSITREMEWMTCRSILFASFTINCIFFFLPKSNGSVSLPCRGTTFTESSTWPVLAAFQLTSSRQNIA